MSILHTRRRVAVCLVALLVLAASLVPALPGPIASLAAGGTAHAATPTRLGDRGLRQGMRGRDVKELQRLLNRAGFRTPVSGSYASHTVRSVRAFQRAAGLEASGSTGRRTVRTLRAAAASGGMAPLVTTETASPAVAPADGPRPEQVATIGPDGLATPPLDAPRAVADLIAAGNEIARTPYRYGGGHRSFEDDAYDCSGSVGYALHGAGLLDHTVTSGDLETWGEQGAGAWITVYANAGHTFPTVAGIRFDTSGQKRTGSRWQPMDRPTEEFVVRHAPGL